MANRDLNVNINGDPKGFQAAAAKAERAAKRLEQSLAKMEAKQKTTQKSASLMRGELAAVAAGAATVAPAFAAMGAGVVAFAALAAPSILKVVQAQQDLAANWDSLSDAQKVSAMGTRGLIEQYKALSKSLEPDTLKLFNQGLSLTSKIMPHLAPAAKNVAAELSNYMDQVDRAVDGPQGQEFLRWLEQASGPATAQIADTLGSGAGAAGELLQALTPLAGAGLKVTGMLLDLVGGAADVAPELVQLAALTVALRGPLGGMVDMVGKTAGGLGSYSKDAKGASLATRALNLVTKAGPNLYVAAGVALAFLAVKALSAESATEKLVAKLAVANKASGNNVAGYQAMAGALQNKLNASLATSSAELEKHGRAVQGVGGKVPVVNYELQKLTDQQRELKSALADNQKAYSNTISGADALGKKYLLTREQALRLADAVGVNLSKGILDGGEISAGAAVKFDNYRAAVQRASNPTVVIAEAWRDAANEGLLLEQRIAGIGDAMNALFNPSIAVYKATTDLQTALASTKEALKESGNSLGTTSEEARTARDQFAGLLEKVSASAAAVYTFTDKTDDAATALEAQRNVVLTQLPELARLAGKNKDAQAQVAALAASFGISGRQARDAGVKVQGLINMINELRSKDVTIRTTFVTVGARQPTGILGTQPYMRQPGATGGLAHNGTIKRAGGGAISGPGSGTSDSIPAWLSDGEYVVNAASTRRYRPLIEAINENRFASGGIIRSRPGVIKGYAAGGPVDAPLGEFVTRFMDGKALSKTDYTKVVRARADAVDQLRKAERKLAADRKAGKSARVIADDEARVAKERRDLATATTKLAEATQRYTKAKLKPAARLSASLDLGIKNTGAFIKNLETIAARGYPGLAAQLLEMGGPEAEAYAKDAAKLSNTKLKALAGKVSTASKQQAKLATMPAVFAVKDARKRGAKSIPEVMDMTGLSEEEISAAYSTMGFERGGIARYSRGGVRPGPGIATRPTVLFGEGRAAEGFVPYDPAYRPQAKGLVSQMARDFGMVRPGATGGGVTRVVIDVTGGDGEFVRWLRGRVKVIGGGNVQLALGKGR